MKRLRAKPFFNVLVVSLLLAACADDSPEQKIASARKYLLNNDQKSAAIQIKSALQVNQNLPEARFLLGTILLKEGNARAAELEFRKALAAEHPEYIVVPELARSMLMRGQAKKLTDEFGDRRFDQPAANANLQTTLAVAYGALRKPDLAEAALVAALQADANYVPALLARARQKAAVRDFDGALQATEAVIAKEPANAEAWRLKGDILLLAMNKVDDALAAYRRSVEVSPEFIPGHLALLTVLMKQGKLDDATKQLEQLKKFAPNNRQTKYFETQLAFRKKDYKLARDLSQHLLKSSPNSPLILQMAGAIELELNSLTQAEFYLTKATQAAPRLEVARRLLILTYLRSGQSLKALAALNAAAGDKRLEPGLFSLAGEVYLQNNDPKKAEEYFAMALKLDPDNVRMRTALAVTHLATGQEETAFDELETVAASDSASMADLALISARWRRGEFEKALAAVEKLEAKQPDKPTAANLRGRIQLAQKDYAAARKSFERALTIDPYHVGAAANLAAMDLADKKPDDAKKRFEGLLAKNPKNGQALLALAEIAAAQGAGKEEVAGLLTKAVDANPIDATPRLQLIELYLRTYDYKQAVTAGQSALAALPDSLELLDALGRAQQASGDLNQAIATFGKLISLQPNLPYPYLRLAGAQLAKSDKQAAMQNLRKALEIKPDYVDAQRALITLALDSSRYQDAVTVARTVQKQHPKVGMGITLEGDINAARKDWGAAATAYRSALQKVQSTDVAIKLHAVTMSSGKAAEAEQFAAAWMKAHPKDSRFLSYQGTAALARINYVAAEKAFLAQLQIQPDDAVALNNLAWVAYKLKKDGALAYAEKANKLAPNTANFMDTLAVVLSEKGEYSKAIEVELKALSIQPTNAALRLNLAKIYLAAGDRIRAKTELDSLGKLGDKHPLQPEVAAVLKTL